MGPVLIANMSHSGVGEPSSQRIHPFFSKGQPSDLAELSTNQSLAISDTRCYTTEVHHNHSSAKRLKSECPPSRNTDNVECSNSSPVTVVSVGRQNNQNMIQHQKNPSHLKFPSFPRLPSSVKNPSKSAYGSRLNFEMDIEATRQPSGRTILKSNAKTGGTLPPPPRAKQRLKSSRIICINYGKNESRRKEMGKKITEILNGTLKLSTTHMEQPSGSKQTKVNVQSANSSSHNTTHPFFTDKSKSRSSTPNQSTHKATNTSTMKHTVLMSTPVSPRKSRHPFIVSNPNEGSRLGIRLRGTKIPGAKLPMWPPKGMSHVRGYDGSPWSTATKVPGPLRDKKSKGHVISIGPNESALSVVVAHIDVQALRRSLQQNDDHFPLAPMELRIPNRHFESGLKVQHRIRPQLSTSSPVALAGKEDVNQDELAGPTPPAAHPAISRHYVSLANQSSAYDRSTCESMAWSQKYAPTSAAQVLQKGKDALYIKEWLQAMKVQSVETGPSDRTIEKNKSKTDAAPRKRRRKNKTDDFTLVTDDSASELEEIFEANDRHADEDDSWQVKKSVMRPGDLKFQEPGRLKNTIVLSGPHGCGKTAAVYAIAKELDFEIFEINASSRRSGKDVLEKVGDMTRNHLVQQHRVQTAFTDGTTSDEAIDSHPRSSKQGMMTAFFREKSKNHDKTKQPPKKTMAAKAQKQSLILLEEADILYEEDKQLWATVIAMMHQSRRPFVITCNDESLIPLQSLHLHGIFRFSPAPLSSAVDVCLLIAANEGHSLCRDAVEALYRSRNFDLRGTISDLNFWCQIGVGDRRGGFDWFVSRWPKGCDLDERGDVVRVISQDTYRHGMGWIGRDPILSECNGLGKEMEIMQQSWDFWQVDLGDWCGSAEIRTLADDVSSTFGVCPSNKVRALEAFDDFYQSQSDADLFSSGTFATHLKEQIDPTLPEMAVNTRDDFIIGRILLDAQEVSTRTTHGQEIALALKSGARQQLCSHAQHLLQSHVKLKFHSLNEFKAISELEASFNSQVQNMTRLDISYAFDPIAVAPKAQPTSYLDPSVFDRTMGLIVLDVAPWVRGIVAFEHQLMQERRKLSSLLGVGSVRKRMRNTRSAYSALEGGERKNTRRGQYFGDLLTTSLVMRTGSNSWQTAVAKSMQGCSTGTDGGETWSVSTSLSPPPE